ncbi:hypothetical protein [Picosynechococcus sp. NKBG042902]|nr:hypothetical protein [Picosynechococcus sp. NKBG042902]
MIHGTGSSLDASPSGNADRGYAKGDRHRLAGAKGGDRQSV